MTWRRAGQWVPLLEYEFATVAADGTTIRFTPGHNAGPELVLPQLRVFSREFGSRLRGTLSAEFFRRRLARRGFTIEGSPGEAKASRFTARRA